jgi:dihydroorotate dehydrogenase
MSDNNFLLKIADVLEALADEKSKLASELSKVQVEQRKAKLNPVIDKLSFVTGEDADKIENKLASASDDVLQLLNTITRGDSSSLGGPARSKTAGVQFSGKDLGSQADREFASWLMNS